MPMLCLTQILFDSHNIGVTPNQIVQFVEFWFIEIKFNKPINWGDKAIFQHYQTTWQVMYECHYCITQFNQRLNLLDEYDLT